MSMARGPLMLTSCRFMPTNMCSPIPRRHAAQGAVDRPGQRRFVWDVAQVVRSPGARSEFVGVVGLIADPPSFAFGRLWSSRFAWEMHGQATAHGVHCGNYLPHDVSESAGSSCDDGHEKLPTGGLGGGDSGHVFRLGSLAHTVDELSVLGDPPRHVLLGAGPQGGVDPSGSFLDKLILGVFAGHSGVWRTLGRMT